jgi:flagellar hook protein FlgE
MLRSMFSGVSGLRTHQIMMDVVANNISNVNTTGFKNSRATFQESISQVLRGASGVAPVRAGVNPMQIGLGVQTASIDGVFTQGATQITGRSTDVSIQGDGFFAVNVAGEVRYTRAGSFSVDQGGNLTGPSGGIVMGWMADPVTGAVDFDGPIVSIRLPAGQVLEPRATSSVELSGNLPATAAVGDVARTSIVVYDGLGNPHELQSVFTKTATNQWSVEFTPPAGASPASLGPYALTFSASGNLVSPASLDLPLTGVTFPGGAPAQAITMRFGGTSPLVQFGGPTTVESLSQDGSGMGIMRGFAIGNDGTISGQFSNGQTKTLGYLALANFNNPSGLVRQGESMFVVSNNSGLPQIGRPGDGTVGSLNAGTLEMSNVDLAQEFTNLIIAQRGFQANSRSITTSDEMLQELVNIKR